METTLTITTITLLAAVVVLLVWGISSLRRIILSTPADTYSTFEEKEREKRAMLSGHNTETGPDEAERLYESYIDLLNLIGTDVTKDEHAVRFTYRGIRCVFRSFSDPMKFRLEIPVANVKLNDPDLSVIVDMCDRINSRTWCTKAIRYISPESDGADRHFLFVIVSEGSLRERVEEREPALKELLKNLVSAYSIFSTQVGAIFGQSPAEQSGAPAE